MSFDIVDYKELTRVRTQIRKLIDIIEVENPELFNSELVKGIIEELVL